MREMAGGTEATIAAAQSTRTLIARPGARFRCAGDGLCCTDLHALGPLSPADARDLKQRVPDALDWNDEFGGDCMRVDAVGTCTQLDGEGRCTLQLRFGALCKPVGCRRFPYGTIDTPTGTRVTTEHRCPCRSLGGLARPPIDLADALACLVDRSGNLEVEHVAPHRVPFAKARWISFADYLAIESNWLDRLAARERAEDVLDTDPLPQLGCRDWAACGRSFIGMQDGTAGGVALAWFGDALLELSTNTPPPRRGRPWSASFERGVARTPSPDDPEAIVNDWLADEIWMLRWLDWDDCTLALARTELATRLAAARSVMRRLEALGLRADQVAAEAVMLVGLAGCTSEWPDWVAEIR
jgi:hypothetical protein